MTIDRWAIRDADRASRYLRRRYSGYSSKGLRRKLMAMLQLYADDSGIGQPPVSAVGGFLAPADVWISFSDEWQAVLDESPAIEYFKLREAVSRTGACSGLSRDQARVKIDRFMKLIWQFKLAPCFIFAPVDDLNDAIDELPPGVHHFSIYFSLVMSLITQLAFTLQEDGIHEKVEFIFDDQMAEKKFLTTSWVDFVEKRLSWVADYMAPMPRFENDKCVVAIQAADALVWWMRRDLVRQSEGLEREPIPFIRTPRPDPPWWGHGFTAWKTRDEIMKANNALQLAHGRLLFKP